MTVYSVLRLNPLLIAEFDTALIHNSREHGKLINSDNFDNVIFGRWPFMSNFSVKHIFKTKSGVIREAIKNIFTLNMK